MTNPRTIAGEPVLISEPDHDREQHLFLTYSDSGTDWHYCVGS
ncbi:MAG TPA: hypothetical protein VMB23_08470 [Spirochaetia bacterium]|jgi:GH43 family beta-xylosidase|nr:hypothetical protein [Spirochaetia bacterium]